MKKINERLQNKTQWQENLLKEEDEDDDDDFRIGPLKSI